MELYNSVLYLFLKKNIEKLYLVLYGLILSLLVVPWFYYQTELVRYSFLPRRILFVLIALAGLLVWLVQPMNHLRRTILIGVFFTSLGIAHWRFNGFFESHYFLQFLYLELAMLVLFAPSAVKEKMLKYSSIVLYIFLVKGLFFRMEKYVHGGLLSSNLYGTYIIYLCFLEVARRRYWNLLPALAVVFYAGSKASYLASIPLVFFAIYTYYSDHNSQVSIIQFVKNKISDRFNFFWALAISAVSVMVFTFTMIQADGFKDWTKMMGSSKDALTTHNNMIMYGLRTTTPQIEEQRKELLKRVETQFHDNKMSSESSAPVTTEVGLSLWLRLAQYSHVYQNIEKYFFLGNTIESQEQMYGHNPHSAVPDIISRLGLLYLVMMLVFYANFYKFLNLLFFNLSLLPILCFQPYGFTIGHSVVLLSLIYTLTQQAFFKEKEIPF